LFCLHTYSCFALSNYFFLLAKVQALSMKFQPQPIHYASTHNSVEAQELMADLVLNGAKIDAEIQMQAGLGVTI
jgi:hypothetical protein